MEFTLRRKDLHEEFIKYLTKVIEKEIQDSKLNEVTASKDK